MDDYGLLSQLETYLERSYGIRVEHAYDHHLVRRFFARLSSLAPDVDSLTSAEAVIREWNRLDLFRNAIVQREALRALHRRGQFEPDLANLLIPVEIKSNHTDFNQRMFDAVVRNFFLDRYMRDDPPLPKLHEEFSSWLLFSLISDRVLIVETDFSHEHNMILKYVMAPYSTGVGDLSPTTLPASLYFSPTISSSIRTKIYTGIHADLSSIFNREIGTTDFHDATIDDPLDVSSSIGFLVVAGRRRDYSCAYIFPIYSLLNRQSEVMKQIPILFDTFLDVLGNEARYRIERNKHHSRLRHTIGVEVGHLKDNYDKIFKAKQSLLQQYEGDGNALNICFAKVNALVHDLSKDVEKQFAIEFDVFGNRRARKGSQSDRTLLSPGRFADLVASLIKNTTGRRNINHFLIDLDHRGDIDIPSESTLGICLTEVFNNAVKYNVAGDRIRVRTRDRADEIVMTISNVGPALSDQEAELVPLMGLRGMNSQRLVGEGSGQGLAAVFSVLEDMGVDADYRQHTLTKEQISRLRSEHGTKLVSELDLSLHTIELALPRAKGGL